MKLRSWWCLICGCLLWFYAMDLALQYGSIWDSQTNPTTGVTVVMKDGEKVSGELRRSWSKDWLLTTDDGTSVVVDSYKSMRVKRPLEPRSFTSMWRSWLPVALISLLAFGFFVGALLRPRRRTPKAGASPE